MEEWEAAGNPQAEVIAEFILDKILPCDECESEEGRIFECDYGHCIHGFCAKCNKGLFCMNAMDPLMTECPCCADTQVYFPDSQPPWYYRYFPLAMAIGWASTILPIEQGAEIRAKVVEAMTRQLIPDFYDLKIPDSFEE